MKTCALFVANSKLIWLYTLFLDHYFVQRMNGIQAMPVGYSLALYENANEICITTVRFLCYFASMDRTKVDMVTHDYPFIHLQTMSTQVLFKNQKSSNNSDIIFHFEMSTVSLHTTHTLFTNGFYSLLLNWPFPWNVFAMTTLS